MLDLNNLTLGQINQIKNLFDSNNNKNPFKIGEKYFIRTVTNYFTGKLEEIYEKELVLSTAAWIADTGRYSEFLKNGTPSEVEPILGNVIVSRGSIIDAVIWTHDLPIKVK
jgi:hypothetical protein